MANCCTHNCRQGRDCPERTIWADNAARVNRAALNRLALIIAAVLLASFAGWFATKAIANAAHARVHAEEWRL